MIFNELNVQDLILIYVIKSLYHRERPRLKRLKLLSTGSNIYDSKKRSCLFSSNRKQRVKNVLFHDILSAEKCSPPDMEY